MGARERIQWGDHREPVDGTTSDIKEEEEAKITE